MGGGGGGGGESGRATMSVSIIIKYAEGRPGFGNSSLNSIAGGSYIARAFMKINYPWECKGCVPWMPQNRGNQGRELGWVEYQL